MSEGVAMFADVDLLHSGGDESHLAGGPTRDGAERLQRGPLLSVMFDGFPTAQEFHNAVSAAHAKHVTTLQAHQEALTAVGDQAHRAAAGFTDMDVRNAAKLQAVRCNSAT